MCVLLGYFLGLQSPFDFIMMAIMLGAVTSIAHALVSEVGKYARHREDVALKRELVDRGLEIDEIERVVASGRKTG